MVQTSACQKIDRCEGEKAAQYRSIKQSWCSAFMCIRYVYSLHVFCNLIGPTGESRKSDLAQKVI